MKKFLVVFCILIIAIMMVSCGSGETPTQTETASPAETSTPTETPASTSETTATPEATPESTSTPTPSPAPTTEPSATPSSTPEASNPAESLNVPVLDGKADKAPIEVRAVYLTGNMAGLKIDHFIDLVNQTELNALVIDIKEDGMVNYKSDVPLVKELGLCTNKYDPAEILKKCHDNGIYVIGRIVCFRDDKLARAKPEWGIKTPSGSLWLENGKGAWTNPSIAEVQQYNIDIAKEAVKLGFDEIQFDYVRFPTGKASAFAYDADMPPKSEVIAGFLYKASKAIKEVARIPVSADVFGIIGEKGPDGQAIGQELELVGLNVDYISPMLYPSHYANDSKGTMGNGVGQSINGVLFTHPDLQPYEVVYNALAKIRSRISECGTYRADVRPYIQGFTASYLPKGYYQEYGVEEYKQQIKAVYDAGYKEWIFWNSSNKYVEEAFDKEQ